MTLDNAGEYDTKCEDRLAYGKGKQVESVGKQKRITVRQKWHMVYEDYLTTLRQAGYQRWAMRCVVQLRQLGHSVNPVG